MATGFASKRVMHRRRIGSSFIRLSGYIVHRLHIGCRILAYMRFIGKSRSKRTHHQNKISLHLLKRKE